MPLQSQLCVQIDMLIPPDLLHLAEYRWCSSNVYFHVLFTVAIMWNITAQIAKLVDHLHCGPLDMDISCPTSCIGDHHFIHVWMYVQYRPTLLATAFNWREMMHVLNTQQCDISSSKSKLAHFVPSARSIPLWLRCFSCLRSSMAFQVLVEICCSFFDPLLYPITF